MSNGIVDLRRYEEGGSVASRLWDKARGLSSTKAGMFAGMLPVVGEGTDLIEIGAGAEDFIRGDKDKSDAIRRMLLGIGALALPFASAATIKRLVPRLRQTRPMALRTPRTPTKKDFGYRWAAGDPSAYRSLDEYMSAVEMSGDPDFLAFQRQDLIDDTFSLILEDKQLDMTPELFEQLSPEERILWGERLEEKWRQYWASCEGIVGRGVRNPRDYASYEDYIRAVEADILELGIEGYDPDFRFNFDESSGGGISAKPPYYDPEDPFFNPSANPYEYDKDWRGQGGGLGDIDEIDPYTTPYYDAYRPEGEIPRIPDDEIPENWWWPTEGMTDDEYIRELERIHNLSFGGNKRFKDPPDFGLLNNE